MSAQINLKSRNFEAVTWPKFKKTQPHPSGLVSYKKSIGFNINGMSLFYRPIDHDKEYNKTRSKNTSAAQKLWKLEHFKEIKHI